MPAIVTNDALDNTTAPSSEPATEPASDPITEPSTEPAALTELATDPITEPATEPAKGKQVVLPKPKVKVFNFALFDLFLHFVSSFLY